MALTRSRARRQQKKQPSHTTLPQGAVTVQVAIQAADGVPEAEAVRAAIADMLQRLHVEDWQALQKVANNPLMLAAARRQFHGQ